MKLQTVVIGSGTPEDPFRCPLPTWTLVDIDYDAMVAVVDVPEHSLPMPKSFKVAIVATKDGRRLEVIVPSATDLSLYDNIAEERYPEWRKGHSVKDIVRGR